MTPLPGLSKIDRAKRVMPGDLSLLGIECALCKTLGHIALDCVQFEEIRGNLRQQWLKRMKDLHSKQLELEEMKKPADVSLEKPALKKRRDSSSSGGEAKSSSEEEAEIERKSFIDRVEAIA